MSKQRGWPAWGVVIALFVGPAISDPQVGAAEVEKRDGMTLKTENFDKDPGWEGVNNRIGRTARPRAVQQDFGFSAATQHAGGRAAGEMGGFISPDGNVAFYGKAVGPYTLAQPLSASGRLAIGKGSTHLLLGFFNSQSVNEWRTPNTLAIRLNGRGEKFFAYVEYCTARWRAGGDTTPFPSVPDPDTGRLSLVGFPSDESLPWTLTYDPQANGGRGVVTATIGNSTAVCEMDAGHQTDGARFDRFGILNVAKSADSGSEAWFDDVVINGSPVETFDRDPQWDGRQNRQQTESRIVRPLFDFGFSETQFAGGKGKGELGGLIFRGDCRYPERMACYGDRVTRLSLDKPLRAGGRIVMSRGVSDSTTLFGFYNSAESMRSNPAQSDGLPESVIGMHIEGPSSDGFHFYPVLRTHAGGSQFGNVRQSPTIYPDGKSHAWQFDYRPAGPDGKARIALSLDNQSCTFELPNNDKDRPTTFDRFGIVTSWIDGNSQLVYWDDVTYTVGQD